MMSKILFLALFAVAYSLPVNDGNADKLVDQLLETVKAKYGAQLDPMHLNDTDSEFSKKIGLITFHGGLKLTNGTIWGLKNIKRSGDCTLTTDKGFDVKVQFGDNNIKVHFNGEVDFMDIKEKGLLNVDVGDFDVKVEVTVDDKQKLHIGTFAVDKLKAVKVDFQGPIKPLDGIIDLIAEAFVTVLNKQAEKLIGDLLKGIVQKELDNFHL